ncbi:MAG: Uma2 family endonuclease [Chloroflexota bacterium]
MPTAFRFTSKDLDAMPQIEGVRYEIIDGELFVSNAPHWHHQYAADEIAFALRASTVARTHGVTVTAPGLVFAEDQDVIPDLIWISRERLARGQDAAGHFTVGPELVVEVLSPGSANEWRDREIKLSLYSRRGVDEYWIVDWRQQTVEVYRRAGDDLQAVGTLINNDSLTSPMLPGFACPIATLWAPTDG